MILKKINWWIQKSKKRISKAYWIWFQFSKFDNQKLNKIKRIVNNHLKGPNFSIHLTAIGPFLKLNKEEFEKVVSEENRLITKGIEVGHIFYFGDKYSKAMGASVDLPGGKKDFVKMGSYGIGVSRLVGAIIEAKFDDKNEIMKWPLSVAPYDCASTHDKQKWYISSRKSN